jgi:hypothetical protein
LQVGINISQKHTLFIFRAEVAMQGSGGIYVEPEEGKAEGKGQSEMKNEKEWSSFPQPSLPLTL